jgi:hypothetical protein
VGGGPAWRGGARGEAAGPGQARGGRKGVTPGRLGHMGRTGRLG